MENTDDNIKVINLVHQRRPIRQSTRTSLYQLLHNTFTLLAYVNVAR